MKTNKTILSAIAVTTMLLLTTSCSKTFYTSVNTNPDVATVVPPNTLLPGIEIALGVAQGGDASRYTQMFMQQAFGTAIEPNGYYFYQIAGTNLPSNLWANMYVNDMENDYALLNTSTSNSYNEYAGISSILMAYSLQVTVDFWGNIPYAQAFLGGSNIEPLFDQDQAVYGNVITLLNTGIADLRKAPGLYKPSTDDIIYQGSAKSWIAFAYAEEARVYLHETKGNSASACTNAINAADSAIAEGFATAQINSWGASANQNPLFQFDDDWADISYVPSGGNDVTLYDTLLHVSDPRMAAYYDTTGASGGVIVGIGSYYGQPTSPVEFLTTEEVYLIKAEATVRSLGAAGIAAAQTYYQQAITANFTKLGVSSGATLTYLASSQGVLPTNVAGALYQIGKQEWETYFLNPEVWADWRRTGAPALQSTVAGTPIPRRMPLPLTETTTNSNAPQNETLWTPVIFWDAL